MVGWATIAGLHALFGLFLGTTLSIASSVSRGAGHPWVAEPYVDRHAAKRLSTWSSMRHSGERRRRGWVLEKVRRSPFARPAWEEMLMRSDIMPGATFPDFELTDHTGRRRKLSELQGDDPMIVVLSRGHFCPKDRRQLRNLVEFYPELKVGYTKLITISTDNLIETNELRDGLGAQWPFLTDPGRKVQKELDIQEYTDPHNDPMIPYTLVLEPGLRIFRIYNGYWYWGRPSIQDLRRDLREMFGKIRPDWDIGDPELRAAWERGERERFFPYRRSRRERIAS
jgi:peroxiredoxin